MHCATNADNIYQCFPINLFRCERVTSERNARWTLPRAHMRSLDAEKTIMKEQKAALNTTSDQSAVDRLNKNKLPLRLTAHASDHIQPGAIFLCSCC